MIELKLHKRWPPKQDIDDDGKVVTRYSAHWEIQQCPGLFLHKARLLGQAGPPQNKSAAWRFHCPMSLMEKAKQRSECALAIRLWPSLQNQSFSTRQEALQALQALLLIEELRS